MQELNKLELDGLNRMGAVRTQVKLTNAIDEALVSRGLLAPRLLRECQKEALVDTGSVYLVISSEIVQQLGLRIIGQQVVKYADGRRETVGVTEAILVEIEGRRTTEDALVTGDEVLIGQVVLEKLDFLVDCKNQRLIPNPANPEYPVTYIK
ncbi:clan AA aspartic protease [Tychonema sp. LEGE 07203]|uniref:aspartyl protease family protein n=1 Tax=Tychonema sp. LEGE 07203 TaxID=1828671 RepID=UPI00188301D2|nr:clan AA aspartic protease [Tychonema sp. LEGE 07203]MBE9093821.1 clan AA aspartic protease [Tychonema sp. LEGE 07203]